MKSELVVNIRDVEFAHSAGMSDCKPSNFKWGRNFSNNDDAPCWFTDNKLIDAANSQSKKKIALLLEPPVIHGEMYNWIIKNEHLFDYILTHQRNLIRNEKYLYYPMGSCWIRPEDRQIYTKNKLLSIIASNKTISVGHRLRHEVVRRFPQKIELFGRGYKPIKYKLEGHKDYMFSLAIMNCKTDDYFTDILIDCFATGTIPVFWGTDNIGQYFNPDGILSFNSLEELDSIIDSLNEDLYLSKIEAIKDNFERCQKYSITEDWIWENYPFLFKDINA